MWDLKVTFPRNDTFHSIGHQKRGGLEQNSSLKNKLAAFLVVLNTSILITQQKIIIPQYTAPLKIANMWVYRYEYIKHDSVVFWGHPY